MRFLEWVKNKFGKNGVKRLGAGIEERLNPQNENFEKNFFKELGIPNDFIENTGVRHFIIDDLERLAGLEQSENLQQLKTSQEVIQAINRIKNSNQLSIKKNRVTITNIYDNDNKQIVYDNYVLREDKKIELREIIAKSEIDDEQEKKVVSYYISPDILLYSSVEQKAERFDLGNDTDYNEIREEYNFKDEIQRNENNLLYQKLYSKVPLKIDRLEPHAESLEKYNIQYGYTGSNRKNLDPNQTDRNNFYDSVFTQIGIPKKFLKNPFIRTSCLEAMNKLYELESTYQVEEYIRSLKNDEVITFNNDSVLIKKDLFEGSQKLGQDVKLFIEDSDSNSIFYRNIFVQEALNPQNQRQGKYDIHDYNLYSTGNISEIQHTTQEEIIFDYNKHDRSAEMLEELSNLDVSNNQTQEGKIGVEDFRKNMQKEYEDFQKAQEKGKEVLIGLGINEQLLEDPNVLQTLLEKLSIETSKGNINIENYDINEVIESLKDTLSWQISTDRVLIYQQSSNGMYNALEFTSLKNGEIQKSNLRIQETQEENGLYSYSFLSDSTILKDGKSLENILKTTSRNYQVKLTDEKLMISLNSLSSLPDCEWKNISKNDLTRDSINPDIDRIP